ncbi:MAG: methyltransferase domain-containing protein [Deltaproteobacteria bacterium]|nr:methyltransferase domain-containing protein [Deltaproteobacteria bacterium]
MFQHDREHVDQVLGYFSRKADEYDLVDQQVYWNLSDRLLWAMLEEQAISRLPGGFRFLDAGGGTGRWSERILRAVPSSRGVLFDLSEAMAGKAKEKAARGGFEDRFQVQIGHLEEVGRFFAPGSFDLIFNFHNVLGFVQDVPHVVEQLVSLLSDKGLFVSFLPNKYHCMFFNIYRNEIAEAEMPLQSDRGRFTGDMPHIHMFTPEGLKQLYGRAGLKVRCLTGFPSLIYPGVQETQLRGSTSSLQNILSSSDHFERIYQMEKAVAGNPDVAGRGNNLFIVGAKEDVKLG